MKKVNMIAISVGVILSATISILIISFAIMLETEHGITYAATSAPVEYKTTSKATAFYQSGHYVGKVKTARRVPVKFIKSGKLTTKQLTHRRNKYIIVEVINGKCIDSKGNGKTSAGYYISYKGVKGHKKGAKYTTYLIYANNNSIDDIAIRIDIKK